MNPQRVSRFIHGRIGSYNKGCHCPKCRNAKRLVTIEFRRKRGTTRVLREDKAAR